MVCESEPAVCCEELSLLIDDENLSSVQLSDSISRETWNWNPVTRVLTLIRYNGSAIEVSGDITITTAENTINLIKNINGNAVSCRGKLKLNGSGKLTAFGSSDNSCGIYVEKLEISGGVINFNGDADGISAESVSISGGKIQCIGNHAGIFADNIEISNGELKASGIDSAIFSDSEISISGGVVRVNGNQGPSLLSLKNINISGGKISTSGTAESDIYAENIRISGGEIVSEGSLIDSCIYADDSLFIDGGSVNLKSGRFRDMHVKYGIKANNKIFITGGSIKTHGYQFGIYGCCGGVEISGGSVMSRGNLAGIMTENEIKITGGVVEAVSEEYALFSRLGKVVVESSASVKTGKTKKNAIRSEYKPSEYLRISFVNEPILLPPRTVSFSIGDSVWGGDDLMRNITGTDWEWKGHEQVLELDGYYGGKISAEGGLNLR